MRRLKRSTSKDQAKKDKRTELIKSAHREYIDRAVFFLRKARSVSAEAVGGGSAAALLSEIKMFTEHAERQIDQMVIKGEKSPHGEKVFSIFEEHTQHEISSSSESESERISPLCRDAKRSC